MRIRKSRSVVILVFILNFILLLLMCRILGKLTLNKATHSVNYATVLGLTSIPEVIEENLTLVIRKFEHFENDVVGTVESFLSIFPNLRVLVVSDSFPYPPIIWPSSNYSVERVKIITLQLSLTKSFEKNDPLSNIFTKYVLFVPDSTRIHSGSALNSMIVELQKQPTYVISAAFANTRVVECLNVNLNIKEWFIEYGSTDGDVCDSITGKHAILVTTETIKKLPMVFMLPFPEAFYVQTVAQNIKVKLIRHGGFTEGKSLYKSSHTYWKWQQLHQKRLKKMYSEFGLKKIIRESGVVEWYGCSRDSARCFSTIVDDVPQYLWEGKWTPPCCLVGLRHTARHVFAQLDKVGVRYWLEGGSLLGAMRSSDILPWDYDVDVGFYSEDIPRCRWLLKAQTQPVVDSDGFVWEKAIEGDFFRVQFSQTNHLHIDLFPFYEVNGTMTKNTWFPKHKQDREFPEYYLRPMSSIEFVGRSVPAPNNIRDFLELKFGENAIENPEYPNPSKLKFSVHKDLPSQ